MERIPRLRDGSLVQHRGANYGIGRVIAVIRDEEYRIQVIRVEWPYEHGIKEHLRKALIEFVPAAHVGEEDW